MKSATKRNFFIIITVIIGIFILLSISSPGSAADSFALIGFYGGRVFGGKVIATVDCTCHNDGTLVIVGSPRGGTFMKTLQTRVFRKYNVSMGRWVLGIASGNKVCKVRVGHHCMVAGTGPIMKMVGTD